MSLAVLALTHGAPARATLIHDLSVTGNFSGTGKIIFHTHSGNDITGVDSFNFNIISNTGGLSNPSFGLADVSDVLWSIDLTDWSLTLFLQTALITDPSGRVSLVLTNDGLPHGNLCSSFASLTTNPSYCLTGASLVILNSSSLTTTANQRVSLTTTANQSVPEPVATALLGLGIAGFALARRRKWY